MFENVTTFDLEQEIERRKDEEKKLAKPKQLGGLPDVTAIRNTCREYIDAVDSGELMDDCKQYIFESSMECFYGPKIWEWVNKRLR